MKKMLNNFLVLWCLSSVILNTSFSDILYRVSQKKWKRVINLFDKKNKVEFLFLAHPLRGNMCPFCFITLTKPLCLLFWTKISMQKILRNANKCYFRPILANWLYQKAYWGLFLTFLRPLQLSIATLYWDSHYLGSIGCSKKSSVVLMMKSIN